MNVKRVTFYPSQIASLMDRHKYKDKDEEFDNLLHRYKTNAPKMIDGVEIPTKYESFISKQISNDSSVRIKPTVERLECDDDVKTAILHKIYTERGIANERFAILDYEKSNDVVVQCPTHFINKHLISNDTEFFVGGKIDGMITSNDGVILVEVKNRQNHFFSEIPDYERIQIECYMRLIRAKHCVFIQRFEGVNQVDLYYPDNDLWQEIKTNCSSIVQKIYSMA